MLAGLCASCFAYFKGKTGFDDPYPEYARHARVVEDEIESFEVLYEDSKDAIEARYEFALKQAKTEQDGLSEAYEAHNAAVSTAHRAWRELETVINEGEMHLRTEVANLITVYSAAQQGSHSPFSGEELQQMCAVPESELPPLPTNRHLPQAEDYHNQITEQRDRALSILSELYAGAKQ